MSNHNMTAQEIIASDPILSDLEAQFQQLQAEHERLGQRPRGDKQAVQRRGELRLLMAQVKQKQVARLNERKARVMADRAALAQRFDQMTAVDKGLSSTLKPRGGTHGRRH
jgi:hypothetical protein